MTLLLDRTDTTPAGNVGAANCVTIGLVNNMPDAALESTERQFAGLLNAAAGEHRIRLKRYSLPEIARAGAARDHVALHYYPIDELWASSIDGLIVTGTEPRAPDLRDEPYWRTLAKIVDWAKLNTQSTIWSCLAAHAAVLHMDGIGRHLLANKCFGIFDCIRIAEHPVARGLPARLPISHSRWNALRSEELAAAGYTILSRSEVAGVDMFVRKYGSLFVFFQGHPEYEASTLMREYRRDVRRFLHGERQTYPAIPQNYFDERMARRFEDFRLRALADRKPALIEAFPSCRDEELRAPWRPAVKRLITQWLELAKRGARWRELPMGAVTSAGFGAQSHSTG